MGKPKQPWQTVSIKPLTGMLDTRSSPSEVVLGAFRYKLNCQIVDGTKLCRRGGHDRLFHGARSTATDPASYTNFDLHDQGSDERLPVTLGFEAQNNDGRRWLYAGTQTALKFLDEATGYWTTVAAGKGGTVQDGLPSTRFKMAVLQAKAVFTNDVDKPLIVDVGGTSPAEIGDLNTLTVTKAKLVIQFNGFLLLMNLEESGNRKSSRVRWSDLNDATKWAKAGDSLADFAELDYGDDILAAAPMAGGLYIYTTRSIWRATIGTTKAFDFVKIYTEPKNQAGCIVYPNTLTSTGDEHWYLGRDGIYRFSPYIPKPERTEWLYRGAGFMFDGTSAINPACCASPVAEAHPDDKEIYLSYPEIGSPDCMNSRTIVFNYEYKSADIVDFGYTALVNYRPSPGTGYVCNASQLFIGASAEDLCLKEIGGIYSRNRCINPDTTPGAANSPFVAQYAYDGYYSILRGMMPLLNYDRNKQIRNFLAEVKAANGASECFIRLKVGVTFSEADANDPDVRCGVIWRDLGTVPLECLDTMKPSEYQAQNLRRDTGTEWTMFEEGRFLYYELQIEGPAGVPANGGACCLSRLETEINLRPA